MTTFSSGLSASIRSYLTLKRALGRQYAAEERVLAHLDRFLAARRVDLVAETFAAWCLTLQHLASGTRRARMRIVRNLCLYRGRSEPGCFVPDERLFPPDHQAIRPHIFTDNEIVQLLAVARTLARSSKSPLRPENMRLAIVVLSTTGLRRGELTQLTVGDYDPPPDLFDKPLHAQFNQEQASSDGGAVLLKAAERIYGLVKAFARCLFDKRAPEKTRHSLADLVGQRIFGIAHGHPDCNDGDRLADDPIHKLLLDRDPVSGERLASQPTLSRFENAVNRCALYRMADELATRVIERHRRRLAGRARRITIDLDPTDDPTHGAQQYTLFNGYYDNWCYLPLLAFLS